MITIREYLMKSDGVQAQGAIVLRKREDKYHPYVVHFRNDQVGGYSNGDYCKGYFEALEAFRQKCKRYDPLGKLHLKGNTYV